VSQSGNPSTSLNVGDLIAGRYRVERIIASGGMGVVLAARHQDLDQQVAIKVLRPDILDHNDAMARFIREARTAARLQSEHTARVFDVGTLPSGVPFMAMEYLSGLDLEQVMNSRGPLPVVDVVDYALQALEAIAEAHALGIVHRDLKPANLFLATRSDGTTQIKLLDFGISKSYGNQKDLHSPASATSTANLIGSPAYMSPEQVKNPKKVDGRADIWALGVIMHELLTGDILFQGETVGETFANVLQLEIKPIRSKRDDVPPGLERVILRCIERDLSRRYADAAELAHDLLRFGSSLSQRSVDRVSSVLALTGSGAAHPLVKPPASSRRVLSGATTLLARQLPTRKLVLGIGAILGVALGVFLAWWGGSPESAGAATEMTAPTRAEQAAPGTASTPGQGIEITPATTPAPSDMPSTASTAPAPQRATTSGRTPIRTNPPKKGAHPVDVLGDRQ
jgi:serine/threonine protein kinase